MHAARTGNADGNDLLYSDRGIVSIPSTISFKSCSENFTFELEVILNYFTLYTHTARINFEELYIETWCMNFRDSLKFYDKNFRGTL